MKRSLQSSLVVPTHWASSIYCGCAATTSSVSSKRFVVVDCDIFGLDQHQPTTVPITDYSSDYSVSVIVIRICISDPVRKPQREVVNLVKKIVSVGDWNSLVFGHISCIEPATK